MEPGKTYVKVLPGRSRPAFVRKRRDPLESGFGLSAIARALGAPAPLLPRRSYSGERVVCVQSAPDPQHTGIPPPPPRLELEYPRLTHPAFFTQEAVQAVAGPSHPLSPASEHQVEKTRLTTKMVKSDESHPDTLSRHACSSCGKYRSPSYNSRHPFVPGEAPKPSICKRCIKEHTSSEESSSREPLKHRRKTKYRKGYRYPKHSIEDFQSAKSGSSSRDEVRIIRVRRISDEYRPRARSRSSSRDCPPAHRSNRTGGVRSYRRRYFDEKIPVVHHRGDMKGRGRARSRSWSRGGSLPRQTRYHRPLRGSSRNTAYYETIHDERTDSRKYREYRLADNEHFGGRVNESSGRRPLLRRNSESMITYHGTPIEIDGENHIGQIEDSYFLQNRNRPNNRRGEPPYDSNYEPRTRRPSNSVGIVRVTRNAEDPAQRLRYGRVAREELRTSLVQPGSMNEDANSGGQFLATGDESRIRRRYTVGREAEEDSEEYSPPGTSSMIPKKKTRILSDEFAELVRYKRRYECVRAPHPPAAPWNPQERYLTTLSYDDDEELARVCERIRIVPNEGYAPFQQPPVDQNSNPYAPAYYRSTMAVDADEGPRKYVQAPSGAIYYRDV